MSELLANIKKLRPVELTPLQTAVLSLYQPEEPQLAEAAAMELERLQAIEAAIYNSDEMQDDPAGAVIRLQKKYATYWRDKSDWYWMLRLFQEVCELFSSLLGVHKDPATRELMQISSICLNWIYKHAAEQQRDAARK